VKGRGQGKNGSEGIKTIVIIVMMMIMMWPTQNGRENQNVKRSARKAREGRFLVILSGSEAFLGGFEWARSYIEHSAR
jgi:hypothetical protein